MKAIIDKIEHLLCVASDAAKAEAAGDTAATERLDMELKRGVESIEQALAPAEANAGRLAWLHSPGSHNVDGWEWGIFRVRWLNDGRGNVAEVLQTGSDFSDLDAARGVVEVRRTEYTPGGLPMTVVDTKPAHGVLGTSPKGGA